MIIIELETISNKFELPASILRTFILRVLVWFIRQTQEAKFNIE